MHTGVEGHISNAKMFGSRTWKHTGQNRLCACVESCFTARHQLRLYHGKAMQTDDTEKEQSVWDESWTKASQPWTGASYDRHLSRVVVTEVIITLVILVVCVLCPCNFSQSGLLRSKTHKAAHFLRTPRQDLNVTFYNHQTFLWQSC